MSGKSYIQGRGWGLVIDVLCRDEEFGKRGKVSVWHKDSPILDILDLLILVSHQVTILGKPLDVSCEAEKWGLDWKYKFGGSQHIVVVIFA